MSCRLNNWEWSRTTRQTGKVLNRILRWDIEADPRHAELVAEQLGFTEDKGIGTPGLPGAAEDDHDDDADL